MNVLYPCCAGLDVHKKTVVACRITQDASAKPVVEVQTFTTMTPDLLRLGDWLLAGNVTQVALESTGVYWQPVYNLLEAHFQMLLVNPKHFKNVPGRKTKED
jgi:transposase